MKEYLLKLLSIILLSVLISSCGQSGPIVEEVDDSAFQRGRSFLKVGKDEEALDEFLSVTRRTINCPKSHLEVGRLFLTLKSRKDPISAIYHFRRFLLLEKDSLEAPKVEQLIVSAEREIIRNLPGEPYSDYLDSLSLRDENVKLTREVSDLRARLGLPIGVNSLPAVNSIRTPVKPSVTKLPVPLPTKPKPSARVRTYKVKQGDSLYAISRKLYGDSSYIDLIYQANRQSLPSKNSLKLGQTLLIPPLPTSP